MKNKFIALLCMAAMWINTSVTASEGVYVRTEEGNTEVSDVLSDTKRGIGVTENTDLFAESDANGENEKYLPAAEGSTSEITDLKIESNQESKITSDSTETLQETGMEELKRLISELENCNPGDVASEDSLELYNAALAKARKVAQDSAADEQSILAAIENINEAVKGLEYISGQSILTNNIFSETDKDKYYPEMSGEEPALTVIETNASYSYEEGSPLAESDGGDAMTDGSFAAVQTGNNVTDPSVAVFDMGDEYFICGIDVFSQFYYVVSGSTSVIRNIKGFEAEISSDGINYKKIASAGAKTEPEDSERTDDLKTSADFAAASGRYIRITVLCDEKSSRYNLREIVIRGFKSPFSRDELYELLAAYSDVDAALYTAQSYNAYKSAYDNAAQIYWDEAASGRVIYDAKIALENAYAALARRNEEIKILSGNISSEFDRTHYAGFALDTADLSYTYTDGSNPQIVSLDASCNKLLQGGCDQLQSANMTYGTWDNANPANILFDMGDECYISGVDVWEYYQGQTSGSEGIASTRAGWVKISVSDDGKNFTQVSEIYNPKNDEENMVANCIAQDFEPVSCRYVLVVVEKGTSHQITLNEVVIKGFKTEARQSAPCSFGIFDYKNESGSRIISLDANERVIVSGSVRLNLGEATEAVVITAMYKDGDIVDWSFENISIDAYGTAEFENEIEAGGQTGAELYTFVWDSLENGLALSAQKGFGSL